MVEQPHLGRTTAQRALVDLGQPRVHARGIGIRAAVVSRLVPQPMPPPDWYRSKLRSTLSIAKRALAEKFRQAALAPCAATSSSATAGLGHGHSQARNTHRVGLTKDMRHVGVIAHNLNGRMQALRWFAS